MSRVLRSEDECLFLTLAARQRLDAIRLQWRDLLDGERLSIRRQGREWSLYTFAGDRINP
jgi:hypothetical protein